MITHKYILGMAVAVFTVGLATAPLTIDVSEPGLSAKDARAGDMKRGKMKARPTNRGRTLENTGLKATSKPNRQMQGNSLKGDVRRPAGNLRFDGALNMKDKKGGIDTNWDDMEKARPGQKDNLVIDGSTAVKDDVRRPIQK